MYLFNLDDTNPPASNIEENPILVDDTGSRSDQPDSANCLEDVDIEESTLSRVEELYRESAKAGELWGRRRRSKGQMKVKKTVQRKALLKVHGDNRTKTIAKPSLVIGIDFGTTHTGASYQSNQHSARNQVFTFHNYPGDASSGGLMVKIPSRIAYASENSKWGPENRTLRHDVIGLEVKAGMKSYVCTKLLLDRDADLTEHDDELLQSEVGLSFLQLPPGKTPEMVTADFLRLYKKLIMQQLCDRFGTDFVKNVALRYLVTVPSQWRVEAIDRTLQAVRTAGFEAKKQESATTVSEPIAGALAALVGMRDKSPDILDDISTCIIIDGGGGTVDLAILDIDQQPQLNIQELRVAPGGKCGSTAIDRRFVSLMHSKFGECFEVVDESQRGPNSTFMARFESEKRAFTGDLDETHRIAFPALREKLEARGLPTDGYDMRNGEVKIRGDEMASLFTKTIREICRLSDKLISYLQEERGDKPDAIIFVGGLAASKYVWRELKQYFKETCDSNLKLLRPDDPWGAISYGAVVYGMKQEVKVSRVASRHYGIQITRAFRDGIDDPRRAIMCPINHRRAGEEVKWLVKKSEALKEQKGRTLKLVQGYLALEDLSQKNLQFCWDVYSCDLDEAPRYFDDRGVRVFAKLSINLTDWAASNEEQIQDVHPGRPYKLKVNLYLTGGESAGNIQLRAIAERMVVGHYSLDYRDNRMWLRCLKVDRVLFTFSIYILSPHEARPYAALSTVLREGMNGDGETALQPIRKVLNVQNDKVQISSRLYRNLEDVAYVQCAILFYTDQSLAFAIARWNMINNYTSATALASLRIPVSIVVNTICILWHLLALTPRPINNELRGYLSGSTMIDMVGEFPPSKLRLLCLDVIFVVVQVLMMVVSHEMKKAQNKAKTPTQETPSQDIDAEEQGIQRMEEASPISAENNPETEGSDHDDMEDECVPILRINIASSMKEISEYRDVDDPNFASQRLESRARIRRLLTTLAQRAARD